MRNGESTSCGCISYNNTKKAIQNKLLLTRNLHIGKVNINYQGCPMKIVEYVDAHNISIQFQDDYKAIKKSDLRSFLNGDIKNPYYPEVYNVGMIGNKYKALKNGKDTKEYKTWHSVLQRCYDEKLKQKQPTYMECIVSEEWKLYENFYEWLHSQENFQKWIVGCRWTIDKDIIKKWNKIYSPDYCILIPENVNTLFTRRQNDRGEYPIGVYYYKKGNCFRAQCMNPLLHKRILIGTFTDPIIAFEAYKKYKENLIKEIADLEFKKNNITKKCYEAMLNYKVEITD